MQPPSVTPFMLSKLSARRLAGAVFLLLVVGAAHWCAGQSGDKEWLLVNAQMWLGGKQLYSDIFQPNLPFITWWYALAVQGSRLSGISDAHLLVVLAFSVVGLCFATCQRLIALHPHFSAYPHMKTRHGIMILLVSVFFVDARFFGDRDHLLVLLLLPYFLRCMPSLDNAAIPARLRLLCAAMGAVAVCIKPHALLMLGGACLLRLVRVRNWRVLVNGENVLIAGILSGYFALMQILTPDYFAYVLPMLMATYAGTTKGIETLQYYVTSTFMLAVTLADFRLRHSSPVRRDIVYFLGLCLFCLGYIVTNNGWIYTFYPLNCVILMLTFWIFWEFRWLRDDYMHQGKDFKQFSFGARACSLNLWFNGFVVLVAAYGVFFETYHQTKTPRMRLYEEMTSIITENKAKGYGTMSVTAAFWPRATHVTGIPMDTRFNHLFMLTKFFQSDEAFAKEHAWILKYTADAYAEDLNKNKPDIMFVDNSRKYLGLDKPFDPVKYFSAYPAFAQAFSHYRLLKVIDRCEDEDIREIRGRENWCRHNVYQRVKSEP